MSEVQRIAEGLSGDERELIDLFDADDDVIFVTGAQSGAVEKLYSLCVFAKVSAGGMRFITLEPLGLEVRAILQQKEPSQ